MYSSKVGKLSPLHDQLVRDAYTSRGYNAEEASAAAQMCSNASHHGIRTHNALKALHLDERFGSGAGGCVPNAEIEIIESKGKDIVINIDNLQIITNLRRFQIK